MTTLLLCLIIGDPCKACLARTCSAEVCNRFGCEQRDCVVEEGGGADVAPGPWNGRLHPDDAKAIADAIKPPPVPATPPDGSTLKDWLNWLVMAILAAGLAYLKQTKHNAGEPIVLDAPKAQLPAMPSYKQMIESVVTETIQQLKFKPPQS